MLEYMDTELQTKSTRFVNIALVEAAVSEKLTVCMLCEIVAVI